MDRIVALSDGKMLVVGLTGGIGTGKSRVSSILRELGAEIVYADLIGHEAYRAGTQAWQEVVEAFGNGILTERGEVDRQKLGAIVFSEPGALARLNSIMHPRINRMLEERIKALRRRGASVVVVEVPLLFEADTHLLVDEVWATAAAEEKVVERLQARDHLDETAIRRRIRSQMPQAERTGLADVVVENSGELAELRQRVKGFWRDRVLVREGD